MRSWLSGLRFRFMLLVVIAMIPVTLLMFIHILNDRDENISNIKKDGIKTGSLCASNSASVVEGCRQLLTSLAYSNPFMVQDLQIETELLQNIKKTTPDYLMIGICSPEGLVVTSSVPTGMAVYANDRQWFKRLQASRDFAVGDYQVGRITGKPGITFGFPIKGKPGEKRSASVYATLDLDVISAMFKKVILPEGCLVNLIDRNGTIIVSNPDNRNIIGKPSKGMMEFRKAGKRQGEYLEVVGSDGVKRLYTFTYVPGSDDGLYVGIGLSLEQIYASTRKEMVEGFMWLGLSIAIAFALVWLITGVSIIRHVRYLVNAARMLAGGEKKVRVELKGGTKELKELSVSFNDMADSLENYSRNLEMLVAERTAALEKANRTLFESEELFRMSFENASIGKSLTRPDGSLARVNQAMCDMLGYTREELQNINFADITHPDDIVSNKEAIDSLFSGKIPAIRLEKRYIGKNGQIVWAELSSVLLCDKENKPLYLITHIIDITDRKRAERELQDRDERYRKLSSHVPGMIYEFMKKTDGTYCVPFTTEAIRDIFGCSPQDVRDDFSPIARVILPEDLDKVIGSIEYSAERLTTFLCEYRVQIPGKTIRWMLGHSTPEKLPDGSVIWYGFNTDITERKLSEEALKISEENYRTIFDAANDAIFLHDPDSGRILDANKKVCEMYSITREEALGLDIEAISEGQPPYSHEEAVKKIRAALLEGPQLFEWKAKDASGRIFWVEVNLKFTVLAGKKTVMAIVRDISERKKAEDERRNLEIRLNQSQKFESLGILAGGIAHDFNNILMAILGNSELGLMNIPDDSPARPRFEEINAASIRASEICKQMLAYSGKGRFIIQIIDLTEVIEEMRHMIEVSVSGKVRLDYRLQKGLPPIEADLLQIHQVIMNLIINASESTGEKGGTINITTGLMECGREYLNDAQAETDLKEGDYVFLEITDTGCGMDKATLSKIFDPFFSTKFTGRGLGLAAVHGIVRGHKGFMKVYSEPGHGTTFKVLFPAARYSVVEDSSLRAAAQKKEEEIFKGSDTILLVDDEEPIRTLGRTMLERMGFSVFSAANGIEAVEIFRKYKNQIACIILDLTMPHMDGDETFRKMRFIRPDIPIIMSSGYNEQDVVNRFLGKGMSGFIQKPYHLSTLAEALKKVITGSKSGDEEKR